jgi:hypothetical protein
VFERDAAGFGDKGRSQMSKVYAGLLVVSALIAMAAIGTLGLVAVTDVGYVAYQLLKPGKYPWPRRSQNKETPALSPGISGRTNGLASRHRYRAELSTP